MAKSFLKPFTFVLSIATCRADTVCFHPPLYVQTQLGSPSVISQAPLTTKSIMPVGGKGMIPTPQNSSSE